jgi:acylphosphatase
MRKQVSITIIGSVQDVGFRYTARGKARSLGLVGFVRNELDGSVYLEAEGDAEHVNRFLSWCAEDPTGSHIRQVRVETYEPAKQYTGFVIEY